MPAAMAAAGQAPPHLAAYLLKANREGRTSNLLGGKYKRRWVELSGDTLVYAASRQELLTGRIQAFALCELLSVRPEGQAKFHVRFPERPLTFKLEAGGSAERDRWVAVLQAAKARAQAEAERPAASAGKLEQLMRAAEQMLLDPRSSSGGGGRSSSGDGHHLPAAASSSPFTTTAGSSAGLDSSSGSARRPLSPRSLLASARAGMAFVSSSDGESASSSGRAPAAARPQHDTHGTVERWQPGRVSSSSDDSEEDGVLQQPQLQHAPGSLDLSRCSLELARASKQPGSAGSGHPSACNSPRVPCRDGCPAAAAVPAAGDAPAQNGSAGASPSGGSLKRTSLTRQLTPGVMLHSSKPLTPVCSQPTPPAAAASLSSSAGGFENEVLRLHESLHSLSPRPSSAVPTACASPRHCSSSCPPRPSSPAAAAVRNTQQSPPGGWPAAEVATGSGGPDDDDEVLRLDAHELLGSLQPSPMGAANMHSHDGGSSSCRPQSAPYRPGTPRKSCLRGSGGGLAPIGSMSSPSSCSAAAAAAVAAADLEAAAAAAAMPADYSCRASPLGKLSAASQQQGERLRL